MVVLLRVDSLIEHEMTDDERAETIKQSILRSGVLRRPILVDRETLMVIDGHHRLRALRELGCKLVPAVLVDYRRGDLLVEPWSGRGEVTKGMVISAALSGRPLPPKTTKHLIVCEGCKRHVECLQCEVNIPLERLRSSAAPGGRRPTARAQSLGIRPRR